MRQITPAYSKNRYISLLSSLLMLLVSVFLLYQTGRSIYLTSQKLEIFQKAQEDVDKLRLSNLRLMLEEGKVVTEDFIETEARDRLNYAKNGEIIFIIPEELMSDARLTEYVNSLKLEKSRIDGTNATLTTYQKWLDFFKTGI